MIEKIIPHCKDGEHVWDAMSEWCTACGISVEEIVQWPPMPSSVLVNCKPPWAREDGADVEGTFLLLLDIGNGSCVEGLSDIYIGF